jgi:hypothetical protein
MDQFLDSCGATGPLVLDFQEDSAAGSARWVFHQPFALVGRHTEADLSLSNEEVGHRHAYLQMIGGRLFHVDLERRSERDDAPLRAGWVNPSQVIRIGPYGLQVPAEGAASSAAAAQGLASPLTREFARGRELPTVTLAFEMDGATIEWPMEAVLAVTGRSRVCAVTLDDPGISHFHAGLLRAADGLWVVDLLSREGVLVDGQRVRCARIDEGSDFQLGPVTVRVRYDAPESTHAIHPSRKRTPAASRGTACAQPIGGATGGELGGEIPRATVEPLIGHVLEMQEQMFGQFQQAITEMADTFNAMHKDHFDFVRGELELIRQVGDELRATHTAEASLVSPSKNAGPAPDRKRWDWLRSMGSAFRDRSPEPQPGSSDSAAPSSKRGTNRVRGRLHDPAEIDAFIRRHLAAYEREQRTFWNKIVRALAGLRTEG